MTLELLLFIQEEHAMTCLQHFARHREVPAADQPHSGDRLVRGAKPAGRDHRRTLARQAGDAVEARGLDGLGPRHRRHDGGQPPR